jgi:hypothetical protein
MEKNIIINRTFFRLIADDWSSLVSNSGKLGLSMVSIFYDLIFLSQYIMYRNQEEAVDYCDLKETTGGMRGSLTINNHCINQFSNLRPVQESPKECQGLPNRAFDEND